MRKLGHEVTQLVPNWNTDLNSRISGCRISSLSYYLIHPLPTVFKTQKLNTSSKFLEIAHLTSKKAATYKREVSEGIQSSDTLLLDTWPPEP